MSSKLKDLADKVRGWKLVQKTLPRIIEYGRAEGILQTGPVNLPTNDITMMHEAIPFLPVPVALLCFFLNIFLPGTGTILSGLSALCMGQPRVNLKEGRKLVTL
ncbi:hypothetical protein OSTOST_15646, partial [Ostertagia ostertagi]